MSQLIKIDKDYAEWVQGLSKRFRNMQIKAATKVNREMLMFYWSLGKDTGVHSCHCPVKGI